MRRKMARLGATPALILLQVAAGVPPPPCSTPCWELALASDTLSDRHATIARCTIDGHTIDGPSSCSAPPCTMRQGENCEVECDRGYYLENRDANLLKCGVVRNELECDFACVALPPCALTPDTLSGYHATLPVTPSKGKEYCTLDGPGSCGGAPCEIPEGMDCDVECDRGYYLSGSRDANLLKCLTGGRGFLPDFSCTACAAGQYKDTVGNGPCTKCTDGQTTVRVGASREDQCGGSWCKGSLPIAHSRENACSTQQGTVANDVIQPGDRCTIGIGVNPFQGQDNQVLPNGARRLCNWTRDDIDVEYHYMFMCWDNGTWAQQDGGFLTPSCRPTTCGLIPLPDHAIHETDPQLQGIDPRCKQYATSDPSDFGGFVPQDHRFEQGVRCNFTCKDGYYKSGGDATRTCNDGQWSGTPLICTRDGYCPSVLPFSAGVGIPNQGPITPYEWRYHSQLVPGCDFRCGSSCAVQCEGGYTREPPFQASFQARCDCPDSKQTAPQWVPDGNNHGKCFGCMDGEEHVECKCDLPPTENAKSCRGKNGGITGMGGENCDVFECREGFSEVLVDGSHQKEEYVCQKANGGGNVTTGTAYRWERGNQLCQRQSCKPLTVPPGWKSTRVDSTRLQITCEGEYPQTYECSGGVLKSMPATDTQDTFCCTGKLNLPATSMPCDLYESLHRNFTCPGFVYDNYGWTVLGLMVAVLVAVGSTVLLGCFRVADYYRCSSYLVLLHAALMVTFLAAVSMGILDNASPINPRVILTFPSNGVSIVAWAPLAGSVYLCVRNDVRLAKTRSIITSGVSRRPISALVLSTILSVATWFFLVANPGCDNVLLQYVPAVILCGGSVLAYWYARADLQRESQSSDNPPAGGKCSVPRAMLWNMLQDLPLETSGDSTLGQSLVSADQDSQAAESPRDNENGRSNLRTNSSSGGGRQVIPFFEITGISAIASGAYGTVYRGHWSSGGMIVALKTARKSATTGLYASVREPAGGAVSSSGGADVGFAQEIQFSEGAAHRNIVQCFGITNGIFPPASRPQDALVMEFVPTTLYQRIHQEEEEEAEEEQEGARQAGGFTPGVRRSVASGIVSGMIFLHKHKKVAHLDIKSHNILMDQDRPKIADFGLTVETAQSLRTTIEVWDRETKSGEVGGGGAGSLPGSRDSVAPTVPLMEGGQNVRGTGAWMAPEIVTRQGEVTTKADVYSFGVVLWELVAPRHDLLVAWVSTA
eukprot:COSAG06_NODE_14_length_35011_cov_20.984132_12_plen_1219_part_00